MKRLLLTFLFSLASTIAIAQTEHMTFKGLPIDGKLDEFISALVNQGFTLVYEADNGAVLEGDFAGKSNCSILVLPTKISKTIWKVAVQFPKNTSWYSLKGEYKTFKASYSNKYGKPKSYEFFSKPYYEGDSYEMQALKLEKCTYISFFELEQGTISIELSPKEYVQINYEDKLNSKIATKEKNHIVDEDI